MAASPKTALKRCAFQALAFSTPLLCSPALRAQQTAPVQLPEVRIEGQKAGPANQHSEVSGLSDAPDARTPLGLTTISGEGLKVFGVTTLSSAIRSEPSVADSYNAVGYIESLQIHGFLLDNQLNYRRDGLPISNYAPFAPENKERIEILEGTTGLFTGTSTPGGLVNYVTKKPTSEPLREITVGLSERGTTTIAADVGGRVGADGGFGYRLNVGGGELRPMPYDSDGNRKFASGAFDWRVGGGAELSADFEYQHVNSISVPALGLLALDGQSMGTILPPPTDPRINLNHQPWTQPFQSTNQIFSVGWMQPLNQNWRAKLRANAQNIRTNDRIAFPDGCSTQSVYVYPGLCQNYDVDIYDFRSDDERRNMNTIDASLESKLVTGGFAHQLRFGLRRTHYDERLPPLQAYNFVGTSNVFAPVDLPADPSLTVANTNLTFRADELSASDAIDFAERWSLWLGARYTRMHRDSERSDGEDSATFDQSFTTPWAALGVRPWEGGFAYVSTGSGVEAQAVPQRPLLYTNYGEALPALRSRQTEIGLKQQLTHSSLATITLFTIEKPFAGDIEQPDGRLLEVADGRVARHRGVDLGYTGALSREWSLEAKASFLDARTIRSVDPELVGLRTTNVARVSGSVGATWQPATVRGLALTNRVLASGPKPALQDNSVSLPSYWQWDAAASWQQPHTGSVGLLWRFGIDNVTDRRYWREAPTASWGATYLFPAQPRTFRISLTASL